MDNFCIFFDCFFANVRCLFAYFFFFFDIFICFCSDKDYNTILTAMSLVFFYLLCLFVLFTHCLQYNVTNATVIQVKGLSTNVAIKPGLT